MAFRKLAAADYEKIAVRLLDHIDSQPDMRKAVAEATFTDGQYHLPLGLLKSIDPAAEHASPKALAKVVEYAKQRAGSELASLVLEGHEPKAKVPKEEERTVLEVPGIYTNMLYEMVWSQDGGSAFVYLDDAGDVQSTDSVVAQDGTIYYPMAGSLEAIQKEAVVLPSWPEEYGSVQELVERIKKHVNEYLDISTEYQEFAVYYILMSWVFDRLSSIPILRALGDFGTGKTRFLDVLGGLCFRVLRTGGSVNPAPIYRMVSRWMGSVMIDESDWKDSDEKAEIIKILNGRIERHRPVLRCSTENPDDVQVFDVFGPTVLASRKRYADQALESRCLTETMRPTRRKIPVILTQKFHDEQQKLRNMLLMYRLRHWDSIDATKGLEIDFRSLEPRLQQMSVSIATILAADPEVLNRYIMFVEEYQKEIVSERADSFEGRIVNYLYEQCRGDPSRDPVAGITAGEIASAISDNPEKKIASRTIGKYLRVLGLKISRKTLKIEGKAVKPLVWDADTLSRLFDRYVEKGRQVEGEDQANSLERFSLRTTRHVFEAIPRGEQRDRIALEAAFGELVTKAMDEGLVYEPEPGRVARA